MPLPDLARALGKRGLCKGSGTSLQLSWKPVMAPFFFLGTSVILLCLDFHYNLAPAGQERGLFPPRKVACNYPSARKRALLTPRSVSCGHTVSGPQLPGCEWVGEWSQGTQPQWAIGQVSGLRTGWRHVQNCRAPSQGGREGGGTSGVSAGVGVRACEVNLYAWG